MVRRKEQTMIVSREKYNNLSNLVDAQRDLINASARKDRTMSSYIDAEWLKIALELYRVVDLSEAPSIEIVRCGECKHGGTEDCPMDEIDDEYFCNFGERKDYE
jgi:hypothetical protein